MARLAAARVAALLPEFERRFPLEASPARDVPVYLLGERALAALAPRGAPARGFYERDEQAVFVAAEDPAELERLLAHECFHAHFHRLVEDPPAWLDEGYADYFAGFVAEGGRVRPGREPVRARDLRAALEAGREARFCDLALRSREAMLEEDGLYLRFAAAWGLVHYFRERDPGPLDLYTEKILAGASPEEAFEAAFGGRDMGAIERALKVHVLSMPDR
jgi:hypothetical protein